jgi:hypothetical protein
VDGPGSSAAPTKSTHENRTPPPVRKSDIGKAGNASGWAGEAPGILKRLFISLTGLLSPEPNKGECATPVLLTHHLEWSRMQDDSVDEIKV